MRLLYNFGIFLFGILTKLISPFHTKAALMVKGRDNWEDKLKDKLNPGDHNIWVHCASLGEFEQGRPVIEAIKKQRPDLKIVLTFFSPSGYEIRKNYPLADAICYMPADSLSNARKFISMVNPEFVIFVKYEFWNNFISELYRRKIPIYLISAIFRPGQHFFKWYGAFFRKMLKKFRIIFVQDKQSFNLLTELGLKGIMMAGDTRFDRVVEIAKSAKEIPLLEKFIGRRKDVYCRQQLETG